MHAQEWLQKQKNLQHVITCALPKLPVYHQEEVRDSYRKETLASHLLSLHTVDCCNWSQAEISMFTALHNIYKNQILFTVLPI